MLCHPGPSLAGQGARQSSDAASQVMGAQVRDPNFIPSHRVALPFGHFKRAPSLEGFPVPGWFGERRLKQTEKKIK